MVTIFIFGKLIHCVVQHNKCRTEYYATQNIGTPMYTGQNAAYDHEYSKDRAGGIAPHPKPIALYEMAKLHYSGRHSTHDEHGRRGKVGGFQNTVYKDWPVFTT